MTTERLSHPSYRRDIDGLRAVAVLSVVAFHAAPGRMPGGFIGVDIFFVISGYLISTIIVGNLEKGSFSFATFYARRVKRIFPALLFVLAACFAFGSVLLTAEEYEALGKQIAAGAGFYANFLFWMQSGYFDAESSMKPLLHLWSLSIEEQFYILWPLMLWAVFRRKASIPGAIMLLALLSFIYNVLVSSHNVTAAFYSPLTRSWELLAGALLACLNLQGKPLSRVWVGKHGDTLSAIGALLIIAGLALINEDRLFPGWWVLLPIVGAVLMIMATERAWINRVILSHPVLVWFGLISYPLYLTHWPILSFLRTLESGEISQACRLYAVLVAIALSWLIYTFIEQPIRRGTPSPARTLLPFGAMVLVWLGGFWVYQHQGMAGRIGTPPQVVNSGDIGHRPFFTYMSEHFYPCTPAAILEKTEKWEEFERCYQSRKGDRHDIAIIGDSHAEHLFIGLAEALNSRNIVYYARGGPPFPGNANFRDIFNYLAGDSAIRTVLIAAKWEQVLGSLEREQQEAGFGRLLETLATGNRTIYLVADIPQFRFGPGKCKYAGRLGQDNTCRQESGTALPGREDVTRLFSQLSDKFPAVKVIHPEAFFCRGAYCAMNNDGAILYRDHDHLNAHGSRALWLYLMDNAELKDGLAGRAITRP
ncbi:MAG: acyltransferase family protein [Halioglobus sp.]